jgi:hypothetical protein
LPNRLEFSLRTVLLLPNAYKRGLQANIFYYIEWFFFWLREVSSCMQYLVDSVLPAPLYPEITIACFESASLSDRKAFPATMNICG